MIPIGADLFYTKKKTKTDADVIKFINSFRIIWFFNYVLVPNISVNVSQYKKTIKV